jgi:hypothetical protein
MIRDERTSPAASGKGWTLREAVEHMLDPAAQARLTEIGARIADLEKPRGPDSWRYAWSDDPNDYRNQLIAEEIFSVRKEAAEIWQTAIRALHERLVMGAFSFSGFHEKAPSREWFKPDLLALVPKLDLRDSSASNPRTGRRLESIRVYARPWTGSTAAHPTEPDAKFTETQQVVVDCIHTNWEAGIPQDLPAKQRDHKIQETAMEMGKRAPSQRIIRQTLEKMRV